MHILFLNSNLKGHINPTLGFVKKLTERHHTVDYFCAESFSEQITAAGGNCIGFNRKLNDFLQDYKPTDHHPFFTLMEYVLRYDEVLLPEILTILKQESYELIICDSIFGACSFLEQLTNIPILCSHSSFAMSKSPMPQHLLEHGTHPQLDHCYQIVDRISQRYGISAPTIEQVFTRKAKLNIVYTTQNFNGDSNITEPEYLFAGPSLDRLQSKGTIDFSVLDNRIPIYISLGSINTDFVEFYRLCIMAFQDTNYYVFMSIGNKCDKSQLGEIPSNFYIDNTLPQLEILSHVQAFITHGGFNSVHEALFTGVPMLALPLVNDQHMVAKRISSLQLGISGSMKELTADILNEMMQILITDDTIKQNVMLTSQEMKHAMNLDRIAEKIEAYANSAKKG